MPELSIVIPAYNEAGRIAPTLDSISAHMETRGDDYEIIVVSDGSTDSTDDIVESYANVNPRIRLISYHPNCGKGCAVRRGMLEAHAKNILLSDADLATPIEEIKLLEQTAATGYDIVVGSRALKNSTIIGWRPWYRRLSGKVFNFFIRMLAVPDILDTQCGFKYFRNGSASKIFSYARLNGFGFDVEALYLARKFGYRIRETAVHWENSPDTKVSVFKHTIPMLLEVVRIRVNDWKKRYEQSPADE